MKLHSIENYPIDIYKGDKLIGTTYSLLTLLDVQVQIQEEQLEGYYIIFKGNKYQITETGFLRNPRDDDFPGNIEEKLLTKLMGF